MNDIASRQPPDVGVDSARCVVTDMDDTVEEMKVMKDAETPERSSHLLELFGM